MIRGGEGRVGTSTYSRNQMADPETKMVWREVFDRFIVLVLSMSFLVVVAAAVAIFFVDSPLDLKIRAWIYVKLDQPDKAMAAYIKLTEVDPGNYKALETIGDRYTSKGAHREASEYYAKAARLNGSVSNLLRAAVSAQKAGLKAEALRHYKQVLALDPNNLEAKANIASLTPPKPSQPLIPYPAQPKHPESIQEARREQLEKPSAPPEVVDRETGKQPSPVSKEAEPAKKPDKPQHRKSIQPCDQMLKEVKDLIGHTEPDKPSLFRERIGDPHRICEAENRKTYCFKCIVRGRLTDNIEIIEEDGRIERYYFGSCGCNENTAK
jgi:tetratricopeptide (TPR) repeat protein